MKSRTLLALLAALAVVAAACDGDETALSTTTSVLTDTTEAPERDTTTTTDGTDTTTSTTLVGETVSGHEVVARISTDNGEVLHIVIPEGAYTDVDLVNFIGDLKEADPDLWGAEVFDDPAAAEAFAVPDDERTEEEQQALDDHHFVTLTNGDRVIFQGPFSEFGEFVLAS
jgi:ABC-type glycerol-3-phosphate transport system substrate-binding protein